MGDKISIDSYTLADISARIIDDDLVILTSRTVLNEAKSHISSNSKILIARRSINYHGISKIFNIDDGTEVLLVNDLKDSSLETISLLKALGIDFIDFYPYYPGIKEYPKLKIAVTPGEGKLVPDCVDKIVDIRTRKIDFTTLVEVLIHFDLLDEKANLLSAKYILDIINLIKNKNKIMDMSLNSKKQLETIINSVNDGIIAFDEHKNIKAFNSIAEKIFGFSKESILSEDENYINRYKLLERLKGIEEGREELISIHDKNVVIKKNLISLQGKQKGEVFTLKDVTEIQRLEEELRRKLISHDHFAKYDFNSIEGDSDAIEKVKAQSKRIAKSNSPILIQGESGTGKELFAQAIHNSSDRRKGPFVAINFAALTDSLIESELFGYDEGAFTGAKKGGMKGLFEQAHGGTIFLDEIGDSPINFQIRLLRVIQEKQIRRIGSSKVIPIDVRIISASNRNLKDLIEQGKFREDLYYRLNVLPLNIPPLRNRIDDIMTLAFSFYHSFNFGKIEADIYFSKIRDHLLKYDWPGNIRELRNTVEYLMNTVPDIVPDIADLPEDLNKYNSFNPESDNIYLSILKEIKRSNDENIPIGRRSISRDFNIPESRARKLILSMKEDSLLKVYRGIRGLEITEDGLNYLIKGDKGIKG
ncbi:MAG: sigma 54-interacting transcriptional regulator [Tissierellia bacterium]|nr:sigma 54-interacting transcriptional regulator [Tissierellia bacterium]